MKYMLVILFLGAIHLPATAQFSKGAKDSAIAEIRHLTAKWYKAVKDRDSLTLR